MLEATKTKYRTWARSRSVRLADFDYTEHAPYHVTVRARPEAAPFLRAPIAEMVCTALTDHIEQTGAYLGAFCLMPDHLHVLMSPDRSGLLLGDVIGRVKGLTTNKSWKLGWNGVLWQPRFHDHIVRKREGIAKVAQYIYENPERKGLSAGYPYRFIDPELMYRQAGIPSQGRAFRATHKGWRYIGRTSMTSPELLADQLDGTRLWTLKLIADLKGDDWTFQPAPGLAHPLWLCGHMAGSQHLLIHVRCLGKGLLDESFTRHFPIGGPVKSAKEHAYPSVETVLSTMAEVHAKTLTAVRSMSEALLDEPAFGGDGKPHPHYKDKRGVVAHCNRHEAFHAGQIAMIRRLQGKSFLR